MKPETENRLMMALVTEPTLVHSTRPYTQMVDVSSPRRYGLISRHDASCLEGLLLAVWSSTNKGGTN